MFAFVFESVGSGEWLVLLAVVLIVVGPKNLPSAARKMGEIMSKLRRAADEFKRQIMTMDEEMKRTANEIKRDYIDIPEDGSGTTSTDSADLGAAYGDPDYDSASSETSEDMGDPSGRYPEEAYGEEPADATAAEAPAETPAAEPAPAPEPSPDTPEKTNGQDT